MSSFYVIYVTTTGISALRQFKLQTYPRISIGIVKKLSALRNRGRLAALIANPNIPVGIENLGVLDLVLQKSSLYS